MKCTADKLITYLWTQVGYLEKDSNAFLDSFKKNAGKKNYTKYANEFKAVTGLNLQAQPWCDMAVDTSFVKVFGAVKAKELLGGFSAYTPTSANYFKKMKRWYDKPCVGDVIFFKNSERINHTGAVVEVSKSKVYTIEGNTSSGTEVIENGGGVFAKSYLLSNERIAGYGRPNYDNPYHVPVSVSKASTKDAVKWFQFSLNKALYALNSNIVLEVDGDYGNKTKDAVLSFWTLLGWNKTGKDDGWKVGMKTIGKLLTY